MNLLGNDDVGATGVTVTPGPGLNTLIATVTTNREATRLRLRKVREKNRPDNCRGGFIFVCAGLRRAVRS
jgi:hypothetical protein